MGTRKLRNNYYQAAYVTWLTADGGPANNVRGGAYKVRDASDWNSYLMHDTTHCIKSQESQESENCRRQIKKCRVRSRLFWYSKILQGKSGEEVSHF